MDEMDELNAAAIIDSRLRGSTSAAESAAALDDREWLYWRYQTASDVTIAAELGVNHKTVRKARERHGILSHPVGPRRGARPTPVPVAQGPMDDLTPDERDCIERLRSDQRSAPTRDLFADRLRNLRAAEIAADRVGEEVAWFALGTAATRIGLHKRQLRRAA